MNAIVAPVDSSAVAPLVDERPPRAITRIGRKPTWQIIDFPELWAARELLFQLARRDVSVRFKQTIFGLAWAVVPALSTMIVFPPFLTQCSIAAR